MGITPKSVESVAPDPATSALVDGTADAQLKALDEIRSTAKWIAAAFAAVGGALITGISLADLGGTTGPEKIIAVCGAAVGIVGVLTVILFATRVLASPFVLLAEFDGIQPSQACVFWSSLNLAPSQNRQLAWVLWRLEANRSLGTYRAESVSEFVALLEEWREEQVRAVRDLLGAEEKFRLAASALKRAERRYEELDVATQKVGRSRDAEREKQDAEEAAETGADELANAESRVRRAQSELRVSEQLAARLLAATQYEYVKQRFDTSRFWIVLAAGFAGAGVLAFVLATSSPK